jgi:hypothetical protein
MRVIGKCYQELGMHAESLTWFRRACSEAPDTREPWCELAKECYFTSRWEECLGAALTCLKITNREKVYTCDPTVWGYVPHDWVAISAWNLGIKDLALEHAKIAASMEPSDLRLRRNVDEIAGGMAA